jgi:multimeric flavodoxin WrbA
MAKTLVGLVASPRKFGNSELFIKELYLQLPGNWQLQLIRLPDMDIRPCKACYQCLFGEEKCPQDDDFALVLETLSQSDAYVVAAPTYLLGANASLKRFLDRGLSFYAQIDRLWGKPAVGVAIAGIEGMEGYTKLNVDSFIKLTMGDLRGSAVVYGALPGEIFLRQGGKETARRLAAALLNGQERTPPLAPACPVCGGDTFRFLPGGCVRCMLCSSSGAYALKEGALQIETQPGQHALFLSYDEAKRHAGWLREMKEQFLSRRPELKKVTLGYTRVGEWVLPRSRGGAKGQEKG